MKTNDTGKKAQSHRRIVEAASRKVRRSGFRGVGVAEIMKEAGLTHGGFYSHFASRDALMAAALVHASKDIGERVKANVQRLADEGVGTFQAFVETYLSDSQIGECANGCPVAALSSDMPGQGAEVLASSRQIVGNLHKLVTYALPEDANDDTAWAVTSSLIGAIQLARTLGDNKRGRAVLAAARTDLLARHAMVH